jgi:uncharacterized protein YjbI with pentapeptide repeats
MPDSENPSAARQIKGIPAQPGEHCTTTYGDWTRPEQWVWDQVCLGNEADFNKEEKLSEELDPGNGDVWRQDRAISSSFLETILLHEPYRSALPRQGVRIRGAWLRDTLDLENAVLDRVWWLDKSRVECDVKLNSLRSSCGISFEGSVFTGAVDLSLSQIGQLNLDGARCSGELDMNQIEVNGSLLMRKAEFRSGINFIAAKVKGLLQMDGARCSGELDMNQIEVNGGLLMRKAEFRSGIDLIAANVKGHLQMDGARLLGGELQMGRIKIDGDLCIRSKEADLKSVSMNGVQVGGQLDLSNANIGELKMYSLDVNGRMLMEEAKFSKFELRGATVRHLYMSGVECKGELILNSLAVKGSLRMDNARFSKFKLESATIGGVFDLSGARCNGKEGTVNIYGLDLNGDMLMKKAEFPNVQLRYARIGGRVDISRGRFTSMDLTGSSIKTVLQMGSDDTSKATWSGKSSLLLLRNTLVDAVQAPPNLNPFPKKLDLNGFKYTHLGEGREEEREELREDDSDMGSRKPEWFIDYWLEKNRSYSPQPYLQLAGVLRNMGHPVKADAILYAGKERERREIRIRSKEGKRGEISKWIGLTLLQYTIGYGYRLRYSIYWGSLFFIMGVLAFAWAYQGNPVTCEPVIPKTYSWRPFFSALLSPDTYAFSLDLLLPVVKLNECHSKILSKLPDLPRYYFYIHEFVGYFFGTFVLAGLSGITKK